MARDHAERDSNPHTATLSVFIPFWLTLSTEHNASVLPFFDASAFFFSFLGTAMYAAFSVLQGLLLSLKYTL